MVPEPALPPAERNIGAPMAGRKILLVESEAAQAIYWDAIFRSLGFAVVQATTLQQARSLLSVSPSIVACSSWVTDGAGIEFFGHLRTQPEFALVYLVLLTSSGEEVIASLRAGANDCVDMSAPYGEIRARLELADRVISLNEVLQKKSAALSDALAVIRTELQSAAALQAAMLPKALDLPGVQVRAVYRPSELLGGDMMAVAPIDAQRIAIALIDVVGHGTASALISCSLIRELIDGMLALQHGPDASAGRDCGRLIIEAMNRRYCHLNLPGMYFTAMAGVIDLHAGVMRYCQAGNPNLVHFDPSHGWRELTESGYPIGLVAEAEYGSREVELRSGQMLLAISDGFLRPQVDDPAGCRSLIRVLPDRPPGAEAVIGRLSEIAAQVQGRDRDDQSALLISRRYADG